MPFAFLNFSHLKMTMPLQAALKELESRLGKPVSEEEEIRLYGGMMFGATPPEGGNNGKIRKMINKIVGTPVKSNSHPSLDSISNPILLSSFSLAPLALRTAPLPLLRLARG